MQEQEVSQRLKFSQDNVVSNRVKKMIVCMHISLLCILLEIFKKGEVDW